MDPISLILLCADIAIPLKSLIESLRNAPAIVKETKTHVQQLEIVLKSFQDRSKNFILTQDNTNIWVAQRESCNKTLSRMHDLLWRFSRLNSSRGSLFASVHFSCGPKSALLELSRELDTSVKFFRQNLDQLLSGAIPTSRHMPNLVPMNTSGGPITTVQAVNDADGNTLLESIDILENGAEVGCSVFAQLDEEDPLLETGMIAAKQEDVCMFVGVI